MIWKLTTVLGPAAALLAVGAGCEKAPASGSAGKGGPPPAPTGDVAKGDSKHAGWWCDEHGIPEEQCSMCSPKVAKAFKDKGDWCEKHDRAKTQCFICDPKLKDKFAVLYREKYGKEPPEATENMPKKDGK